MNKILEAQAMSEGSDELKALRKRREEVEEVFREEYGIGSPRIAYAGSKAKGTLIRESYDLDIICYFDHDDESAGKNLAEIYASVAHTLSKKFMVIRKTSALRLQSTSDADYGAYFRIDVVPGRFVDGTRSDCFLYQSSGEKQRLKTNLATHVNHVKKSGVIPAVKLLKLWRVRRGLNIKQFVFELLVIGALAKKKDKSLSDQLQHFWETVDEHQDPIPVQDPANPEGNDLSDLLNSTVWSSLRLAARSTLNLVASEKWEGIFGKLGEKQDSSRRQARIASAAAAVHTPTRPWCW